MITARDTMKKLFAEAEELQAREHSGEEENELRGRAPAIIEAACREQYKETGSVFAPGYCSTCQGCPLSAIVVGIARSQ